MPIPLNPARRREAADDTSARPSGRKKADEGLPDEGARREKARTYIDLQRRLWPEFVRAKRLPPMSEKFVAVLADQSHERLLGDGVPLRGTARRRLVEVAGNGVPAVFLRQRRPRSPAQQLKRVPERAARGGVFISRAYVFADAAVSDTTTDRRGHRTAKPGRRWRGNHDQVPHVG